MCELSGCAIHAVYKNELAVGTASVTVTTGQTVTKNIADTHVDDVSPGPSSPHITHTLSSNLSTTALLTTSFFPLLAQSTSYIWQIGDFDGTPAGFKNANKIETMHPSDARMGSWSGITYTVGSSSTGDFPMAIFKAVGAVTVKFNLTSSQTGARTVKIATTLAFAGGRPIITVNSWSSSTPAAPSQPDSRGVTRGTWRGNNIEYTYSVRECRVGAHLFSPSLFSARARPESAAEFVV